MFAETVSQCSQAYKRNNHCPRRYFPQFVRRHSKASKRGDFCFLGQLQIANHGLLKRRKAGKMLLKASFLIPAIFSSLVHCSVLPAAINVHGEGKSEDSKNAEAAISAVLTIPTSRAYNCFLRVNYNCDLSDPGAITNSPNFLKHAAQNGHLASAGNPVYDVLNEHAAGRWSPSFLKLKQHNATYFSTEISWTLNEKSAAVESAEVYLSNADYRKDRPIQASSLNLACAVGEANVEDYVLRFDCYIHKRLVEDLLYQSGASGVLLSRLRIAGANYAFYQVADVSLNEPANEISNFHGFVFDPPSRAKLCQLRVNKNCGLIVYEPQSVEGFKGFPDSENSPPDGKIASANNNRFAPLDEYGEDRWTKVRFPDVSCYNETHVSFNISWFFTAPHSSQDIRIFISNEHYNPNEPLSRRHLDLNPLCVLELHTHRPPQQLTLSCPISLEKYRQLSAVKDLLILSVWNVYDTPFGFYQVMDFEGLTEEQSYENVACKCQEISSRE